MGNLVAVDTATWHARICSVPPYKGSAVDGNGHHISGPSNASLLKVGVVLILCAACQEDFSSAGNRPSGSTQDIWSEVAMALWMGAAFRIAIEVGVKYADCCRLK